MVFSNMSFYHSPIAIQLIGVVVETVILKLFFVKLYADILLLSEDFLFGITE
jgi:hypothetical protein